MSIASRWPLLLVVVAAGCSAKRPPPADAARSDAGPGAPRDANGRLDELVREHLDATMAASPTRATWLGVHVSDDRLDDLSPEAAAREVARLRSVAVRARAIAEQSLDENHRIDRALLERDVAAALLDLVDPRPLERNPARALDLLAAGIDELLVRDFRPLPDRIRMITSRLGRVRPLLDEARRSVKNPPEIATRRAVELAQSLRGFVAETLPKAVNAVGDERLAADFRAAQGEALRALDDFSGWLQREVAPRSKGEIAVGRERLADRLRVVEGIETPLEQLLADGERELRAARVRFEDAARAVGPGKSAADALRALEDDHATAEDLLPSVSALVDASAAFVRERKLLTPPDGTPPRHGLRIAEMPPFLWGFVALSSPGPLEARAREAYFYVDPVDRSWNKRKREEHLRALNRPQLVVSVLHETVPGHHVQLEVARRAPTVMQRVSRSLVFAEGWAHYAQQVMLDEGFAAGDAKVRAAHAREVLVRACRLVAALRLHAFGAKLDDATRLFSDEGALEDWAARREAERAATDPMVLAPTLGRMEIVALREAVREARGDEFSVGEFHDRLLVHGALPLSLARKLLLK